MRQTLRATAAITLVLAASLAQAQAWPSRPVKLVVPFSPGGFTDVVARILGQKLTESLGQPVVIENKPGAGSTIGSDYVAKSKPDGYTLVMVSTTQVSSPWLYKSMPYDVFKDFTPIMKLVEGPYVLIANPKLPVKSVADLLALVRTTTVAQLLEREDFSKRYKGGSPISVLELLYPLMQGYDSVAIEADVEIGGTDQTFNILLGRDIQRHYGLAEQAVLTMPILAGIDGVEKMSKTKGNEIATESSADEMFGRPMRLPDEAMASWFELLAISPPADGTGARDTKVALAKAIVARFHNEVAADAAEAQFVSQFAKHELPEDIDEFSLTVGDGMVHLPQALAEGFDISRSEARRLVEQGGVKIDGEAVDPAHLDLDPAQLSGAVVQIGRRRFKRFKIDR